jgi:hypothetical protein
MKIMNGILCLKCNRDNCIPEHDEVGWTCCILCGSTKNSIPNIITGAEAKYSKYD